MRIIGWRENPAGGEWILKDWTKEDYEILKASHALFARKFNSENRTFLEDICKLAVR